MLDNDKFIKNSDFLMTVYETMRDGLMVVNPQGNIIYFNRAAEEITGYSKDEVIGKECMVLDTSTCIVTTESGKRKKCDLFEKGNVTNRSCQIKTKDGRTVYLLKNASILKDGDQKIIGAVESMTDITSLYMKEKELEELKHEMQQECGFMGVIGASAVMQKLFEQIQNTAMSEAPVIIYGESGTGKELVAHAVHELSRRKNGPFIKVNCAALNEFILESELFGHKKGSFTGAISDRKGRFEAANNGSIFFDEIGDMPMSMQVKLLRVLQEKEIEQVGDNRPIPVNIRLISATNKDLSSLVSMNKFREDLLYRINAIPVHVPSLRERKEDLPILISHYLKTIACINNKNIQRISPEAMTVMENYTWPGNVRQLINALEYGAITSKNTTIDIPDLPDYMFSRRIVRGTPNRKDDDRQRIETALALFNGSRTLAAKHLGISRVTLWKKMKDLRLA